MNKYRRNLSYLLAILMLTAVSSRFYLTHDRGFYDIYFSTEHASHDCEKLVCNCPICHAEDFVATEAKFFEYNPIITTLLCEFEVAPTASANSIVITSSLRGPPCLS